MMKVCILTSISQQGIQVYFRWQPPHLTNTGGANAIWTWTTIEELAARFASRQELLDTLAALRLPLADVRIEEIDV